MTDLAEDKELAGFVRMSQDFIPLLERSGWVLMYPGGDGIGMMEKTRRGVRFIHSIDREEDGEVWAHLSMSRRDRTMPTWEQIRDLVWLVYPGWVAVVVIAPQDEHVNIPEVGHAWICLTRRAIPDFTRGGHSI